VVVVRRWQEASREQVWAACCCQAWARLFKTLRAAKLFDGEVRSAREDGETVDPRGGKTELHVVYESWLASRPDLSPKVRRGHEDNWRPRIEPKFGNWPIGRILRENVQEWVDEMTTAGLGPRTVRWTHSVLRMTLHHAIADRKLRGKKPCRAGAVPGDGRNQPCLSDCDRSGEAGRTVRLGNQRNLARLQARRWC
jgi:hypothetical protein